MLKTKFSKTAVRKLVALALALMMVLGITDFRAYADVLGSDAGSHIDMDGDDLVFGDDYIDDAYIYDEDEEIEPEDERYEELPEEYPPYDEDDDTDYDEDYDADDDVDYDADYDEDYDLDADYDADDNYGYDNYDDYDADYDADNDYDYDGDYDGDYDTDYDEDNDQDQDQDNDNDDDYYYYDEDDDDEDDEDDDDDVVNGVMPGPGMPSFFDDIIEIDGVRVLQLHNGVWLNVALQLLVGYIEAIQIFDDIYFWDYLIIPYGYNNLTFIGDGHVINTLGVTIAEGATLHLDNVIVMINGEIFIPPTHGFTITVIDSRGEEYNQVITGVAYGEVVIIEPIQSLLSAMEDGLYFNYDGELWTLDEVIIELADVLWNEEQIVFTMPNHDVELEIVWTAGFPQNQVFITGTHNGNFTLNSGDVLVIQGAGRVNGTITVNPGGHLIIDGNILAASAAVSGRINVHGGDVTMLNGRVRSTSSNTNNQTVTITNGGTFVMHNGFLQGAGNTNGNFGVLVTHGTFTMYDGTIIGRDGTTSTFPPAVMVQAQGVFNMHGGIIRGNESSTANRGTRGVDINGGLFVMSDGATIRGRTHDNRPAVVLNSGHFQMYGGTIYNGNIGLRMGGGTFVMNGGLFRANEQAVIITNGVFTMNNGTIDGQGASTSRGVDLNGIHAQFIMNDGLIHRNLVVQGAGVRVRGGASFVMNGGDIDFNRAMGGTRAARGGGGVMVTGAGSTFVLDGGNIINNVSQGPTNHAGAPRLNGFDGRGGGVLVTNNADFTMYSGLIDNNQAPAGGGVAVLSYRNTEVHTVFNLMGGTISNNRAINTGCTNTFYYTGGGVHVIAYNRTANAAGRGTVVTFNMYGGEIVNNASTNNTTNGGEDGALGGGVGVHTQSGSHRVYPADGWPVPPATAVFNFNGGVIAENSAFPSQPNRMRNHRNGVGIFPTRGRIAGGGVVVHKNGAIMNMGAVAGLTPIIENNTAIAGGGVAIIEGGVVNMYSGYIRNNTAQGGYINTQGIEVRGGGGVFIQNNNWSKKGQGIHSYHPGQTLSRTHGRTPTFNMLGGEITGNVSPNGGGVFWNILPSANTLVPDARLLNGRLPSTSAVERRVLTDAWQRETNLARVNIGPNAVIAHNTATLGTYTDGAIWARHRESNNTIWRWQGPLQDGTLNVGVSNSMRSTLGVGANPFNNHDILTWGGTMGNADNEPIGVLHTVTFHTSGGATFEDGSTTMYLQIFTGQTILYYEVPELYAGTGHVLTHWLPMDPVGVVVTSDMDFFAAFDTMFTVTYHGNYNTGGDVPVDPNFYNHGDIAVALPSTLTRTNHVQSGWFRDFLNSGSLVFDGGSFTVFYHTNLFARWIPQLTPLGIDLTFTTVSDNIDEPVGIMAFGASPLNIETFDFEIYGAYGFHHRAYLSRMFDLPFLGITWLPVPSSEQFIPAGDSRIVHAPTPEVPGRAVVNFSLPLHLMEEGDRIVIELIDPLTDMLLDSAFFDVFVYEAFFDSQGGTPVPNQIVRGVYNFRSGIGNPPQPNPGHVDTPPPYVLLPEPTPPTRTGFSFEGWFINPAAVGNAWNFAVDTFTDTVSLYAHWVNRSINIDVDNDGNVIIDAPPWIDYDVDSDNGNIVIILVPDPGRDIDTDDIDVDVPNNDWDVIILPPDSDGNVVVILVPPVYITFLSGVNGTFATGITSVQIRFPRDGVITAANVPEVFPNIGWDHVGWTPHNPVGHVVTAPITFTAVYEVTEHTVIFMSGAYGWFAPGAITTITVPHGQQITAAQIPGIIAMPGFGHIGWAPHAALGHAVVADITFTALYSSTEIVINVDNDRNVDIVFLPPWVTPDVVNDGPGNTGDITITLVPDAGTSVDVGEIDINVPNPDWIVTIHPPDSNGVVVIVITPAVYVTFAPGQNGTITGGTPALTVRMPHGTTLTAAHVPAVVPNTGWNHLGWTPHDPVGHVVNENITFTATYEPAEFTVTFLAGAHGQFAGGLDTITITVPHSHALLDGEIPSIIADAGFTFIGWNIYPVGFIVLANVTFYAMYHHSLEELEVRVVYNNALIPNATLQSSEGTVAPILVGGNPSGAFIVDEVSIGTALTAQAAGFNNAFHNITAADIAAGVIYIDMLAGGGNGGGGYVYTDVEVHVVYDSALLANAQLAATIGTVQPIVAAGNNTGAFMVITTRVSAELTASAFGFNDAYHTITSADLEAGLIVIDMLTGGGNGGGGYVYTDVEVHVIYNSALIPNAGLAATIGTVQPILAAGNPTGAFMVITTRVSAELTASALGFNDAYHTITSADLQAGLIVIDMLTGGNNGGGGYADSNVEVRIVYDGALLPNATLTATIGTVQPILVGGNNSGAFMVNATQVSAALTATAAGFNNAFHIITSADITAGVIYIDMLTGGGNGGGGYVYMDVEVHVIYDSALIPGAGLVSTIGTVQPVLAAGYPTGAFMIITTRVSAELTASALGFNDAYHTITSADLEAGLIVIDMLAGGNNGGGGYAYVTIEVHIVYNSALIPNSLLNASMGTVQPIVETGQATGRFLVINTRAGADLTATAAGFNNAFHTITAADVTAGLIVIDMLTGGGNGGGGYVYGDITVHIVYDGDLIANATLLSTIGVVTPITIGGNTTGMFTITNTRVSAALTASAAGFYNAFHNISSADIQAGLIVIDMAQGGNNGGGGYMYIDIEVHVVYASTLLPNADLLASVGIVDTIYSSSQPTGKFMVITTRVSALLTAQAAGFNDAFHYITPADVHAGLIVIDMLTGGNNGGGGYVYENIEVHVVYNGVLIPDALLVSSIGTVQPILEYGYATGRFMIITTRTSAALTASAVGFNDAYHIITSADLAAGLIVIDMLTGGNNGGGGYAYHTVTFLAGAQGGFLPGAFTQFQVRHGLAIQIGQIPVIIPNTGWTHIGWTPSNPLDFIVTDDITFTAIYDLAEFTVTFLPGTRGSFAPGAITSFVVGHSELITPAMIPEVIADAGWIHFGWNPTNPDGHIVTSDIIFTALYGHAMQEVVFDAGTHGEFAGGVTTITLNMVNGAAIAAAWVPEVFTEPGYVFVGWAPADPVGFVVTGDITFTAQFTQATSTVTFSAGMGEFVYGAISTLVVPNDTVIIDAMIPEVTPPFGWIHVGWSPSNPDGHVVIGDITFTATFAIAVHTVTFTAGTNGELEYGAVYTFTVPHGTAITAAQVPGIVANPGWFFTGWTPVNPAGFVVTDDIEFVAAFGAFFTVTYHGNGHTSGDVPVDPNFYSHGDIVTTLHGGSLYREYHIQGGWFHNVVGGGSLVVGGGTFQIFYHTNLYARWIPRLAQADAPLPLEAPMAAFGRTNLGGGAGMQSNGTFDFVVYGAYGFNHQAHLSRHFNIPGFGEIWLPVLDSEQFIPAGDPRIVYAPTPEVPGRARVYFSLPLHLMEEGDRVVVELVDTMTDMVLDAVFFDVYVYEVHFDSLGGTAVASQTLRGVYNFRGSVGNPPQPNPGHVDEPAPYILIPAPTAPTRLGHNFAGWFTTSATSGTAWDFAVDTFQGEITLFAGWTVVTGLVNIDVDEYRDVNVSTPAWVAYAASNYGYGTYGNIIVLLTPDHGYQLNAADVSVSVPYGWTAAVSAPDQYGVITVTITPPAPVVVINDIIIDVTAARAVDVDTPVWVNYVVNNYGPGTTGNITVVLTPDYGYQIDTNDITVNVPATWTFNVGTPDQYGVVTVVITPPAPQPPPVQLRTVTFSIAGSTAARLTVSSPGAATIGPVVSGSMQVVNGASVTFNLTNVGNHLIIGWDVNGVRVNNTSATFVLNNVTANANVVPVLAPIHVDPGPGPGNDLDYTPRPPEPPVTPPSDTPNTPEAPATAPEAPVNTPEAPATTVPELPTGNVTTGGDSIVVVPQEPADTPPVDAPPVPGPQTGTTSANPSTGDDQGVVGLAAAGLGLLISLGAVALMLRAKKNEDAA